MNGKAFTLIEILVVTAIIMIVTGTGIAGYRRFNRKQILQTAAAELKSNLSLARSWAMAPRKVSCDAQALSGYRIEIASDSYEIYEVCDDASSSSIETFNFPDALDEVAITLNLSDMSEEVIIKTNGQIE